MARPETSQRAISLLPFLQPSGPSPRLVLTEGNSDASYPFAMVDDTSPFTRVIAGSFLTDAGSRLKNVFLVLQRDMYRQKDTIFSTVTNLTIEADWLKLSSRTVTFNCDNEIISLTTDPCDNANLGAFSPLLFCRKQKLFIPLLCPSCARELELCHDDELLTQKGLHPYSTSIRRYLYCPSCSSSGQIDFFVREREDADPLFLSDCMDLVHRLNLLADKGIDPGKFSCISCVERESCFGASNCVHSRLSPFSFYPFHLLIVKAPTLNALDFNALLSGTTSGELVELLDRLAFPGRISSLNAIDSGGVIKWTIFSREDERALPELFFLKLSLLEEVMRRVVINVNTPLQGERAWVYLPKIGKNLPMGWNFKIVFIDDLAPEVSAHRIESNTSSALARSALFFFQILLSSKNIGNSSIVEAVSQYLSSSPDTTVEGSETSTLKRLCKPAGIFLKSDGYVLNQQFEDYWDTACAAGFVLLDIARGKGLTKSSEIYTSLSILLEETRSLLFCTGQPKSESNVAERDDELEKRAMIRRIVAEMIASNRAEFLQKPLELQPDRQDEVVETVILRATTPSEPLYAPNFPADADATVIIPIAKPVQERPLELLPLVEDELMETVVLLSRHFAQTQQAQEVPRFQHPLPTHTPTEQQACSKLNEEQDDLSETVMISAPSGRHRPVGGR